MTILLNLDLDPLSKREAHSIYNNSEFKKRKKKVTSKTVSRRSSLTLARSWIRQKVKMIEISSNPLDRNSLRQLRTVIELTFPLAKLKAAMLLNQNCH